MDGADSYKRMSGNGREKKTDSLSESAVCFLTQIQKIEGVHRL